MRKLLFLLIAMSGAEAMQSSFKQEKQAENFCTVSQCCENHGTLTIKAEIISKSDEILRKDGEFREITLKGTDHHDGSYTDEVFQVNGEEVTLRKTILLNGKPCAHSQCHLIPLLQNRLGSSTDLIRKLLDGSEGKKD